MTIKQTKQKLTVCVNACKQYRYISNDCAGRLKKAIILMDTNQDGARHHLRCVELSEEGMQAGEIHDIISCYMQGIYTDIDERASELVYELTA